MLAKQIPGILPPFTLKEALVTTKINSVSGNMGRETSLMPRRPFRSPHHTISDMALVGGEIYPPKRELIGIEWRIITCSNFSSRPN